MTASLDGHVWPETVEFGQGGTNPIACTRCGLKVYLIVHNGRFSLGVPINTPCSAITAKD